jgi:hypothetical protein
MASIPSSNSFSFVGGAKFRQTFMEWSNQSSSLFYTLFIVSLFVYTGYAEKVPMNIRWQLSSTLGRLLLLLLLYIVHEVTGWIPALLFTIAIGITWYNRPLEKPIGVQEGFQDKQEGFLDNMKVTKVQGQKWFVEEVLKENPKKIVEDRVSTFAVQDETQTGTSRTSK